MAKRGTLTHPRCRRLAALLTQLLGRQVGLYEALGLMESLWHATAARTPRGDIGRITDQDIADEVWWAETEPGALVDVLVRAGVLELHADLRLVVHGWSEHADDTVRRTLQRKRLAFWDGQPPRGQADEAEGAAAQEAPPPQRPDMSGHVASSPDKSNHDATSPVMTRLPEPGRAVAKPGQGQRREAGGAGGVPRAMPTPPARPPSLADSVDHDPDDPDQRRLAERLAGIERQLAAAEGRAPTPAGVRRLLESCSSTRRGVALDSLRRASPPWLAVTDAACATFERENGLFSPPEVAEAWLNDHGGPETVALAVRSWIAQHAPDEPLEVALERWALEPGEDGQESPSGIVEALLPLVRRSGALHVRRAADELRVAG